jgi:anti-anti-sigma factor
MTAERHPDLVEVQQAEGVTVVRFTRRTILDPDAIEAVGDRLLGLVRDEGCRKLVLSFGEVESLTSSMLGKFVGLHQAVEDGGGRMVFAHVDPFLQQIFHICNLPPGIATYPDEASAVAAVGAS